jgi:hypothetical protein
MLALELGRSAVQAAVQVDLGDPVATGAISMPRRRLMS